MQGCGRNKLQLLCAKMHIPSIIVVVLLLWEGDMSRNHSELMANGLRLNATPRIRTFQWSVGYEGKKSTGHALGKAASQEKIWLEFVPNLQQRISSDRRPDRALTWEKAPGSR